MGYSRAGFEVAGVDIEDQPRYPFRFVKDDAIDLLRLFADYGPPGQGGSHFDAIHASPPCQDHMRSRMRGQTAHGTGWLLEATRELLEATGLPWVIENVPGAPMRADYRLCGCMFGLPVARERWFETSWQGFEMRPPCHHPEPIVNPMRTAHGPWFREHGRVPTRDEVAAAMGIDWMRGEEIKQAIPPAYTEYIGALLLAELGEAAA